MSTLEKIKYTIFWVLIFVTSISMIIYGCGKPLQFSNFVITENSTLSKGHQAMWTFYSYSLAYPLIIGTLEIIGGLTILFNKTRILGCILLTIILSNIIIQDYVYEIKALNTAIFYQCLVIGIMLFEKEKINRVIHELFAITKKKNNIILLLVALLVTFFIKYLETIIL